MTIAFFRTGQTVSQQVRAVSTSSKADFRRTTTQMALLELLRVDAPERFRGFPPDLAGQVDWDYLAELAYREGLAPLVYHTLSQGAVGATQTSQTRKFQYIYQLTRRRYTEATQQLAQVLRRLQAEEIEPLLLKGAALAGQVYPDPGLRPFADMDVLVRGEDLEGAHRVLTELGYRHNYQGREIAQPGKTDVKYRSARQYFHQNPSYPSIDLYWQLGRFPYLANINQDALWSRSQQINVAGVTVQTPSPEDEVLHLALDFALGVWYGHPEIRVLRDIAQIVEKRELNWARLAETARDSSLLAPIYFACRVSKELLGANVPDEFPADLHPEAGKLNDWIVRQLSRKIFGDGHPLAFVFLTLLVRWSGPDRLAKKVGWTARIIVPPPPLWGGSIHTLKRVIKPQTPS